MFSASQGGEFHSIFPVAVQSTTGTLNDGALPLIEKARRFAQIRIGISARRAFLLLRIQHNQRYYNSCTVKKQPLFVIKILGYVNYI